MRYKKDPSFSATSQGLNRELMSPQVVALANVLHCFSNDKTFFRTDITYCPYCRPRMLSLASKQKVQINKKKEGKSCIGGAEYAAKEYLPPPS